LPFVVGLVLYEDAIQNKYNPYTHHFKPHITQELYGLSEIRLNHESTFLKTEIP